MFAQFRGSLCPSRVVTALVGGEVPSVTQGTGAGMMGLPGRELDLPTEADVPQAPAPAADRPASGLLTGKDPVSPGPTGYGPGS